MQQRTPSSTIRAVATVLAHLINVSITFALLFVGSAMIRWAWHFAGLVSP